MHTHLIFLNVQIYEYLNGARRSIVLIGDQVERDPAGLPPCGAGLLESAQKPVFQKWTTAVLEAVPQGWVNAGKFRKNPYLDGCHRTLITLGAAPLAAALERDIHLAAG